MGRLISHRLLIIRPELGGGRAPVGAKARPGKRAGMLLDPLAAGLGDWVETWAKPIAIWIDARVLPPATAKAGRPAPGGQHAESVRRRPPADPALALLVGLAVRAGWVTLPIAGCSACSRRRRFLNALVPALRSWAAWRGAPWRLFLALTAALSATAKAGRPTPGGKHAASVQPAGNLIAKPPPAA